MTVEIIDWLDLDSMINPGGLMGIEVDSDGRLLIIDSLGERILRIAPMAPVAPAP